MDMAKRPSLFVTGFLLLVALAGGRLYVSLGFIECGSLLNTQVEFQRLQAQLAEATRYGQAQHERADAEHERAESLFKSIGAASVRNPTMIVSTTSVGTSQSSNPTKAVVAASGPPAAASVGVSGMGEAPHPILAIGDSHDALAAPAVAAASVRCSTRVATCISGRHGAHYKTSSSGVYPERTWVSNPVRESVLASTKKSLKELIRLKLTEDVTDTEAVSMRSHSFVEMVRILEDMWRRGIRAFPAAGTMLGAARAGGFLPFDRDVDIAILDTDSAALSKAASFIKYSYDVEGWGSYSLYTLAVKGDRVSAITKGLFPNIDGPGDDPSRSLPLSMFTNFTTLQFYCYTMRVPVGFEAYLAVAYGPRWCDEMVNRCNGSKGKIFAKDAERCTYAGFKGSVTFPHRSPPFYRGEIAPWACETVAEITSSNETVAARHAPKLRTSIAPSVESSSSLVRQVQESHGLGPASSLLAHGDAAAAARSSRAQEGGPDADPLTRRPSTTEWRLRTGTQGAPGDPVGPIAHCLNELSETMSTVQTSLSNAPPEQHGPILSAAYERATALNQQAVFLITEMQQLPHDHPARRSAPLLAQQHAHLQLGVRSLAESARRYMKQRPQAIRWRDVWTTTMKPTRTRLVAAFHFRSPSAAWSTPSPRLRRRRHIPS